LKLRSLVTLLDKVAEALANPRTATTTVIIHGHTDAVGGAEYNRVLSRKRAEAARQYFIEDTASTRAG